MGSLILLPLYYQLVRHQSPIRVGLLLAPQGLGAAMAMPVAGWLTDKVGARLVVPAGLAAALLGTLAYTQVGANTSYLYLAASLLVLGLGIGIGIGIGSTILPSMAVAFQTLTHQEMPKATSALNAIQRIAGAIGTALLAIVLQRTIAANLPHLHGGIKALAALPPRQHAQALPGLTYAFDTSFWLALALIAASLAPALLLPRPAHEPGAAAAESATQSRAAA